MTDVWYGTSVECAGRALTAPPVMETELRNIAQAAVRLRNEDCVRYENLVVLSQYAGGPLCTSVSSRCQQQHAVRLFPVGLYSSTRRNWWARCWPCAVSVHPDPVPVRTCWNPRRSCPAHCRSVDCVHVEQSASALLLLLMHALPGGVLRSATWSPMRRSGCTSSSRSISCFSRSPVLLLES